MSCEGLTPAVPKRVYKDLIVLDGDGADCAAQIKCAPLEHDTVLVVDAGALWENEEGGGVCSGHMGLHSFPNKLAVLHLQHHNELLTNVPNKTCSNQNMLWVPISAEQLLQCM